MFQTLAVAASLLTVEPPATGDELLDGGSPSSGLSGWVQEEVAPIPDVVVTITGPAVSGEIVLVTDGAGYFSSPLPPGTIAVRFEKEGFRPYVRTGLVVPAGQPVGLRVQLLRELDGEVTITLVCGSIVDVGRAEEGGTAFQSALEPVPVSPPFESGGVSRSFDTLVRVFPGLAAGASGTRSGADLPRELAIRLDRVPVRDPVLGLLAVPVAGALVDETSVVTAAPDATRGGSTSAWLEASTLSGGNEVHGQVFATTTPSALGSGSATLGDVGASLGGFLARDRLWFSAGGQWPWAAPVSLDPGAQGLLKVTALISPDARVEARYVDAGARLLDRAVRSRVGALSGALAALDKRLLFDLDAWWMGVSDRSRAAGMDLSSQSLGGAGTLTALVTAWGHHALRLGVEGRSSSAGSSSRDVLSSFVDESWAVADRITVLLGARVDVQRLRSGAGEATVSGGLLPRLGAVFDRTQRGDAKIFGWWGRLEDNLPLVLLAGSPAPVLVSGLRPPAAEEWSLGTQLHLMPLLVGLRYGERRLTSAVGRVEVADRLSVANPGEGAAVGGQHPVRLQRALTLSLSHPFADLWILEASARLERLTANVLAPVLLDARAGLLSAPVEAWLPELKVATGRSIPLSPRWRLQLGASFALRRAIPESERFVPSSSDLAWMQRVDVRAGIDWLDGNRPAAGIAVEVFDLFDAARALPGSFDGRSVRLSSRVAF